ARADNVSHWPIRTPTTSVRQRRMLTHGRKRHTVGTWPDDAADSAMRCDLSRTRSRLGRLSTRSRRPHDRREDRRPGAADLHPSADVSPGDPDAEARRGDTGRGKGAGWGFQELSMNCQVIDMARRYGWMIALTREDHICSLGIAALGFEKPTHPHNSGTLCEGMYTET